MLRVVLSVVAWICRWWQLCVFAFGCYWAAALYFEMPGSDSLRQQYNHQVRPERRFGPTMVGALLAFGPLKVLEVAKRARGRGLADD